MQVKSMLALSLLLVVGESGQQSETMRHGNVERIQVHGQALEGNLEGDSPDRQVAVYLPPSY